LINNLQSAHASVRVSCLLTENLISHRVVEQERQLPNKNACKLFRSIIIGQVTR